VSNNLRLSALHIYPVKSCAPLAQEVAQVLPRGLAGDRRWMIVDPSGRFVTGRQQPRLTLIRAEPVECGLRLSAPGLETLTIAQPARCAPRQAVTVWRSEVDAPLADRAAAEWIGRFLGSPANLVYMDDAAVRAVDGSYGRPGDEVSFADGFPLLLIGEGSLAALNARLAAPVPMLRFRPNLVVAGATPHAEDGWKTVRVGNVEFEAVKPCSRCIFTTVIHDRGELDPSGEPMKSLKRYRTMPGGVMFGQNLIARGTGTIRVGDAVEVA
jgi:uncharacterized protein YcbX